MLLHVCLVLVSHGAIVYSASPYPQNNNFSESLQLLATPDYPVARGQRVDIHCSPGDPQNVSNWQLVRIENNGSWTIVGTGRDLTLTEPEQSGGYRCCANSPTGWVASPVHTVYIVSIQATAPDHLGVPGFVLSVLALLIDLAIVFWLVWQKLYSTLTVSQTSTTGPSIAVKQPEEDLREEDADRDVYMNYTSSNPAYTDLDPKNMNEDNLYSSLS